MVGSGPISNDSEMDAAMARVEELFRTYPHILDAGPGNPQYDELRRLTDLVLEYDDEHYPIPDPPPHGAIEFWMDQLNLTVDDLVPCIGSQEAVAEVLAGRREVTPEMAQALYESLNIDVRDLLGQPASPAPNS